jgi:hypothetical protein
MSIAIPEVETKARTGGAGEQHFVLDGIEWDQSAAILPGLAEG